MDFYIKQTGDDKAQIVSVDTDSPISVDMNMEEAVQFLRKMSEIKSKSLKPEEPRLFYNRMD